MNRVLFFVAAALTAACARSAAAGTVEGKIVAGKDVIAPAPLSVAVDAWACAPDGKVADPSLRIDANRGLADVVVRITGAKDAPPYAGKQPAVLDQKGCEFTPHVVVVAPNEELLVKNSDAVLHNFHTLAKANRSLNQAQIKGKQDTFRFSTPEIIPAECDVHYWMSAVVVVAESAWTAITAPDGTFAIEGVTPGTYSAELWHQRLGVRTVPLRVDDKGGRINLEWDAPAPGGAGAAKPATSLP
jgi:plastocyanin